jgi:hypothetical protein
VVTILLQSATDKMTAFETLILELKICIVIFCSSYEVKKNRNLHKNYEGKKETQQHQCFSTANIGVYKDPPHNCIYFTVTVTVITP